MKKFLYSMVVLIILLSACNADEPGKNQSIQEPKDEVVEEITKDETQGEPKESEQVPNEDNEEKLNEESKENQPKEMAQPLTEATVKEILEYYAIREGDKLSSVSFIEGEIKATFELAPNKLISAKEVAVTRYSHISDELLKHEGWEILTITYINIGMISMNRNEKETNESGDYFPTTKIEERLK
ncbi:hypothetical protein V7087_24800 [Neobacillus niacini]|uniref:hypothetical protein n=1 Tax=Neobacillus niacini TaxID=86668 RepID=UPI002FFFC381